MNVNHAMAVRSHFSVGESLLEPKKIPGQFKEAGYESVVLMDTMSVNGMVDLFVAARKTEIKPVVGCRLRVVPDPTLRDKKAKHNAAFYPKVYVKNAEGMADLMGLLSRAYDEDRFYMAARIGIEDLIEVLARGNLVFSTGDFYSVLHYPGYRDMIERVRTAHGASQTFAEVVAINTPLFDTLNAKAIALAEELSLPLVLTRPSLYTEDGDADSLDVLTAISGNIQMTDRWRSVPYVRDFGIKSPTAVVREVVNLEGRLERFDGVAAAPAIHRAIAGMKSLVDLCDYSWDKLPISLPRMATDEFAQLVVECKRGWSERLGVETLGYKPGPAELPVYVERLKYELGVLKKMGFERYFLIVQGLVRWSKNSGILVGPGRGSVGGSLVAYLLGITDVDPIRFNLLFERFINPERIDLPDADLDFMSSRRHEVIKHLVDRYGEDRVAGISNYTKLASASAMRGVGRVHGLTPIQLAPSKYVPKEHGVPVPLEEAAGMVPELSAFKEEFPDIWRHALKVQGKLSSMGQHAAGVVIAAEPINRRAVVIRRATDLPVVNWDKRSVEDWGLIKIDILGLSTLDILAKALDIIEKSAAKRFDLTALPLDDEDVMEAFSKGDTVGVFQFESSGMQKLLKDLAQGGRLTFDDLSAATALYRPGPMDSGLMDDYVAIKQGFKTPYYEHPALKSALCDTHGILIFQEQIMQAVQVLAGFSMVEADHVRKAIGKKDAEKMKKMKDDFVNGATAGFVEVELENGKTAKVHRLRKFSVKESPDKFTIEQVATHGYTIAELI